MCVGLASLVGALASAAQKAQDPNKILADDQLKLARLALKDLDRMRLSGESSVLDPRVAVWERRQIEALRASGAGKEELIVALKAYAKRMKDLAQVAEGIHAKSGQISRVDVNDAKYRALEAEMWVNDEKSR